MCIIIHNKFNTLPKKSLKKAWTSNPDGAGLMYVNNNRINIFKSLNCFDSYYKEYQKLRSNKKIKDIILHFRIGTSGLKDINNVHPFIVNNNLAFCHNGIFSNLELKKESNISDTLVFNETILKQLPNNFLNNSAIIELITDFSRGSKLVFLDINNNVTIINSHLGHTDKNNNWYSNYSYCTYSSKKSYNRIGYNKNSYLTTYFDDYTDQYDECILCGEWLWTRNESKNKICNICIEEGKLTDKEIQEIKDSLTYTP